MTAATDTVGIAGDCICSVIERVERAEEEIKDHHGRIRRPADGG